MAILTAMLHRFRSCSPSLTRRLTTHRLWPPIRTLHRASSLSLRLVPPSPPRSPSCSARRQWSLPRHPLRIIPHPHKGPKGCTLLPPPCRVLPPLMLRRRLRLPPCRLLTGPPQSPTLPIIALYIPQASPPCTHHRTHTHHSPHTHHSTAFPTLTRRLASIRPPNNLRPCSTRRRSPPTIHSRCPPRISQQPRRLRLVAACA